MTTATAEKIEAVAAAPKLCPVTKDRFIEAQFGRNAYVLNLPSEYDYAELFRPENWKLISGGGKVHIGDTIEVRKDDLSLWALLLVRESIEKHARIVVAEIFKKDFAPIGQTEGTDEMFEIKFLGLQDHWAVYNKSTGRQLVKDLKSEDAARDYVNNMRPRKISGG